MPGMMRHRSDPYSCGCCYPYWDKKNGNRTRDKRGWRRDYEDDMSTYNNSERPLPRIGLGPPQGGMDREQDGQDEALLGEGDAGPSGVGGSSRSRHWSLRFDSARRRKLVQLGLIAGS